MNESQVLWLNVTNAVLGILVLLPLLALLIAAFIEIGRIARRRFWSYLRFRLELHHLAHLGAHR